MAIFAERTSKRVLITIDDDADKKYILQRAFYKDRTWKTWIGSEFAVILENPEIPDNDIPTDPDTNTKEPIKALAIGAGDFIDSSVTDGLWEYRYYPADIEKPEFKDFKFSKWVKFGTPDAVGYSFNNYHPAAGEWGTIVTPDDMRYTYLWGTDLKATNGTIFTDEQIQFFIDESLAYMERELNLTLKKRVIKSEARQRGLQKGVDYDTEEALYDFSYRKIQRYGMIQTRQRPIINVDKCELIYKDRTKKDLLPSVVIDYTKGIVKFLERPYKPSERNTGITSALFAYGQETFQSRLFYAIDYSAGYETSDEIPADLRQAIAKVAAISLLNIIGDGLMSGFSSSSLSLDGMSESFSSTQSATSAYFGARISQYKDDIKQYIQENKYKFGFLPMGCL